MSSFTFPKQDHTAGAILCDHLDRDPRVRAAGYSVRDGNLLVQVDADDPATVLADTIASIQLEIQRLRASLELALQI